MKYLFNFFLIKNLIFLNKIKVFKFLKKVLTHISYNIIFKKIFYGFLIINQKICKKNLYIFYNDIIKYIVLNDLNLINSINFNNYIPIIFEDDNLLVIKKPVNLLIHSNNKNFNEYCLTNNILYYYGNKSLCLFRTGVLHRLDKNTSGIMIISKSIKSYVNLIKQIKLNILKRFYITILLGKSPLKGKVVCNIKNNKNIFFSKTNFFLLKVFKKSFYYLSLVKCNLLTGRTNQIRIHFSAIKNPLFLDKIFSKSYFNTIENYFLFSYYISFYHPVSNFRLNFTLKYDNINIIEMEGFEPSIH